MYTLEASAVKISTTLDATPETYAMNLRCRGFEHFSQAVHHAFVIIQHFGCPAQIKAITVLQHIQQVLHMDMYSGRLVNNMVMLETTCGTTMETNSVIISAATI